MQNAHNEIAEAQKVKECMVIVGTADCTYYHPLEWGTARLKKEEPYEGQYFKWNAFFFISAALIKKKISVRIKI